MIKNSKEMITAQGQINRDFLKGRILFNTKASSQFGKVLGFYKSTDDNKTQPNMRFFNVRILTTGEEKVWWLDKTNGELNENLHILKECDEEFLQRI